MSKDIRNIALMGVLSLFIPVIIYALFQLRIIGAPMAHDDFRDGEPPKWNTP